MSESFMHAFLHIPQSKVHSNIVIRGVSVSRTGQVGCSPLTGPTILCAGSQQINDVLVLPNDLHHLHL